METNLNRFYAGGKKQLNKKIELVDLNINIHKLQ